MTRASTQSDVFGERFDVSRETLDRLVTYEELIRKWTAKINLVSPSTLDDIWGRHFMDSAQILDLIPMTAKNLVDLGSGGGFPGIVLAILLAEKNNGLTVTLIESDMRKWAFLQTVTTTLGISCKLFSQRIEDVPKQDADVVTARALAPLNNLLGYVDRHLVGNGTAILMKGQNHEAEIREASKKWSFDIQKVTSQTDPQGVLLKVSNLRPL